MTFLKWIEVILGIIFYVVTFIMYSNGNRLVRMTARKATRFTFLICILLLLCEMISDLLLGAQTSMDPFVLLVIVALVYVAAFVFCYLAGGRRRLPKEHK